MKRKMKSAILLFTLAVLTSLHAADKPVRQQLAVTRPIPNELIDFPKFLQIARDVEPVRAKRRVTEEQFAAMAAEPSTVVLDARSADKFRLRHIRGAVSLPFTDFTEESLAKMLPQKTTRVLIYCNNNFRSAPVAFAAKSPPASLNISTYVALATYGYTNVYELGPLLDVTTTKLVMEGTEVSAQR
jgi:rhodanese-related sulfurtransferase